METFLAGIGWLLGFVGLAFLLNGVGLIRAIRGTDRDRL